MEDEFKLVTPRPRAKYDTPTLTEKIVSRYLGIYLAGVGVSYLLGGAGRFNNPALITAAGLAPWWVWGVIFIAVGLLILLSFNYMSHWVTLGIGGYTYAFFALLYIFSIFEDDRASYVAAWSATMISIALLLASWRRRKTSIKRELRALTPSG